MCQAVCPLFLQTKRETDVARGKIAILQGLAQKILSNPKKILAHINHCLLCGSCAANCPCKVDVLEIFIKARVILTEFIGLSSIKKIILRKILAKPETFNYFAELGVHCQKLAVKPADEFLDTSSIRFFPPLTSRHIKLLAQQPFHVIAPSLNTFSTHSKPKAAFFVGCLIDKIFPSIGKAVIDVLRYHNIGIFMPEKQGCCGIPAITSGDITTFERLVHYNIRKFNAHKFDYLVTACATCTYTIKKIWPMMMQKTYAKSEVEKFAQKTIDINQFITSIVGIKNKPLNDKTTKATTITYHDPCHLAKSLNVSDEPRELIKANPHYRFKEMLDADKCCGLGGSFGLNNYKISASIGKDKCANIKASGCSTVATSCPACMIQLYDMLSKAKERIAVRHSIEIYVESLTMKDKKYTPK